MEPSGRTELPHSRASRDKARSGVADAGLSDWAVHHRLGGWHAVSWPAEIDVFLAVGELALYVAHLDCWPTRCRIWPWATALTGLAVSISHGPCRAGRRSDSV